MRFTLLIGAALCLSVAAGTRGSVVLTDRDDDTNAIAKVQRLDNMTDAEISAAMIYSDADSFTGLAPGLSSISSSASGTLKDTATNTQLVASGNGAVSATSQYSYYGGGNLMYSVNGQYV